MPDTAGAVSDAAPSPPGTDVVCVLGQTGAGKTRLAVEIALECGGEVVNCDAMQVYAGLPIATAQASAGEMRGVPHHMLGCVDPFANGGGGASTSGRGAGKTGKEDGGGITVRDFRDAALGIIGEIRARGKTPVLVGGSDYYLRAVVCESLLDDGDDASRARRIRRCRLLRRRRRRWAQHRCKRRFGEEAEDGYDGCGHGRIRRARRAQ